eukprot:TRINITY_DN997_c0_g1_i2.p1 TRINITY_DN997_c0_g1~~TRINITY_DN997_c0_g1_i2.p1  ORF type:complete len:918 (-),score=182.60 TRINITY_DN997_c0_g1_i2:7500-10253(-)
MPPLRHQRNGSFVASDVFRRGDVGLMEDARVIGLPFNAIEFVTQRTRSQQHHAQAGPTDGFAHGFTGSQEMRPFAVLACADRDHRCIRQLQTQVLDQVERCVLAFQTRVTDGTVIAAAFARDGFDLQCQLGMATIVEWHAVQVPRHFIGDIGAGITLAGIHQMVSGCEPVAIEYDDDVGPLRFDFFTQPCIAGNQIRVLSSAHGAPKLFTLHQARMVRHDGRSDDFSHFAYLLLTMTEAWFERLLGNHDVLDVAEKLEAPIAAFAADSASLDATERCIEVSNAEAVDPDKSRSDPLSDAGGMFRLAEAHAAQTVVGAIGHFHGLLVGRKGLQGQDRPKDLVLDDLVFLSQLGQHRGLVVLEAKRVLLAAPQQLGATIEGTLNETLYAIHLPGMDDRADFGTLFPRIPDDQLLDVGTHHLGESIGNPLVNQEAGSSQAHLAGIAIHQGCRGRCTVKVGILQDDECALAAQFETAWHQVLGGGLGDPLCGGNAAGEGNPCDPWIAHQLGTCRRTAPLHDIQYPRRQACCVGRVGQQGAGERRPFWRFQDTGVTGGKGRAQLPGRQHERRVPRRDDDRDAGRIVTHQVMCLLGVDRTVLQRQGMLGKPFDIEYRARHHAMAHARQQHASIHAFQAAEIVGALGDFISESVQIDLARWGIQRCPARESRQGAANRLFHMRIQSFTELGQRLTIDGTEHIKSLGGRNTLTTDVMVGRQRYTGYLDPFFRHSSLRIHQIVSRQLPHHGPLPASFPGSRRMVLQADPLEPMPSIGVRCALVVPLVRRLRWLLRWLLRILETGRQVTRRLRQQGRIHAHSHETCPPFDVLSGQLLIGGQYSERLARRREQSECGGDGIAYLGVARLPQVTHGSGQIRGANKDTIHAGHRCDFFHLLQGVAGLHLHQQTHAVVCLIQVVLDAAPAG